MATVNTNVNPGGGAGNSYVETGMLVGNFEFNP